MELIELQQCIDRETAEETIRLLEDAKIAYRRSSGLPSFDVSTLGSSAEARDEKIIISVAISDFKKARAVMEADALTMDLPEDYHLLTAKREELEEIVEEADEWSPFDVAHARRLLEKMGVEVEDPEVLAAKRMAELKKGKKASFLLISMSIILPIVGVITTMTIFSIIGSGIALSITLMKSKTLEGRFYTYDKSSRTLGLFASIFAVAVTILGFLVWGQFIRYGDYDLYIPGY